MVAHGLLLSIKDNITGYDFKVLFRGIIIRFNYYTLVAAVHVLLAFDFTLLRFDFSTSLFEP